MKSTLAAAMKGVGMHRKIKQAISLDAAIKGSPHALALRIALVYAALLSVWMFFISNALVDLGLRARVPHVLDFTLKNSVGALFILLTSALLYVVLRHVLVKRAHDEELFATLFRNNPGPIGMGTAAEGRLIDINQRYAEFFGYSREEMIGRTVTELGLWENPEERNKVLQRLHEHGSVREHEVRFRRRNGEIRHALLSFEPVIDTKGELLLVTMITDVTERKQVQEELQRSQSFLEQAQEVGKIGSWVAGLGDDGSLWASREVYRIFGVSEDTPIDVRSFVAIVHPEDRAAVRARVQHGIEAHTPVSIEHRIMLPNGEHRWVYERAEVIYDADDRPLKLIGVVQDISDRIQRDETLRHYTERLQTLSQSLLEAQERERQHIARELHDQIGQALTAVQINLQTEMQHADSGSRSRIVDSIAIVEQVLEQVRDLSLNLRPPMLDDLGLIPALRWYLTQQAQRAGLQVELDAEPVAAALDPACKIACFRIVQEAVTNIVRHAKAHKIGVRLWCEADMLQVVVRDDGTGFDVDAFRHSEKHHAHLGLIGMEERATLLGGHLQVTSVPGDGTEVRIQLPLKPTSH